jgi:hypothetical protein
MVDGQLWTVLDREAPDAPFGLRLDGSAIPGDLGALPGDPVSARAGFVSVGPAVVDCRTAARWIPNRPEVLGDGWPARFDEVGELAQPRSWPGSADLALQIADALMDRPGSRSVQAALNRAVGRGPGLTPSGDDVLMGLLACLWLAVPISDRGVHKRICSARRQLARAWQLTPSRTTDVGHHQVDQAVAGVFGSALHRLLKELARTDAMALRDATGALLANGASSGADTCVGVAAGGRVLSHLTEGSLP